METETILLILAVVAGISSLGLLIGFSINAAKDLTLSGYTVYKAELMPEAVKVEHKTKYETLMET